jgi:murein DD-endopeptidase MepM/ murein hydrolase activator NlpD
MHPRSTTETKAKKSKFKINTLPKNHPRRVEYEKSARKSGINRIIRDFRNGTHTYSVALLSGLVAITPLVVVPPLPDNRAPVVVEALSEATPMGDLLTGMGGPEMPPIRSVGPLELFEDEFEGASGIYDVFSPQNQTSFVTVTKIVNHLKVANTVMPTTSAEVSSDYGWRTPPCSGCSADHQGVDFVPGFGEPIFAVADGMVIEMGGNGGYGNYVKLKHLIGNAEGVIEEWVTLYAHMKNDSFPEGMMIGSVVEAGDIIGAVGNTGMSTGPHLHFELLINGENVDPLPLLGTYEVIIVSEEDYPDYMFVGETIKKVETVVTYE